MACFLRSVSSWGHFPLLFPLPLPLAFPMPFPLTPAVVAGSGLERFSGLLPSDPESLADLSLSAGNNGPKISSTL